jgi:hypothetical protein
MLIGPKKTLYGHITELLLVEPSTVLQLQENLTKHQAPATLQGIYKALRELITEDIVVKQKQVYSINNIWRERTADLFMKRSRFALSPGEQVTYRFKKLEHLDAFWKHTLTDIEYEFEHFPIFHFTPHQFWPFVPGRRKSEEEYYKGLQRHATQVHSVVGGNTFIDKLVQQNLRTEHHHIFLDPTISFSRRDHISIIGDYIIITRISVSLAKQVDEAYSIITDESVLTRKFMLLFKNPGSITMIIENNRSKAKRLRKRLSADFHISLELREKFDLF